MQKSGFVSTRNRPVAELVYERLQEIPTRFGRLVYLARCADGHGRYRHEGLRLTHDRASVDAALAAAHEKAFADWLAMSLAQQHEDLLAFLDGLNQRRALDAWGQSDPWPALAPRTALAAERELFASDLRTLIAQMPGSI